MNDRDDGIDDAKAARIGKNIDLAFRFLDEVIDDPARLAELPDGATVAPLPPDDPELARETVDKVARWSEGGRDVRLYRIGAPPGERFAWAYRTVTPRWPTEGIEPVVEYHAKPDVLVVDFFNGRRQGIEIPTREFGTIFVDQETEEVVVNILPRFLGQVIQRDPGLIDVLLRPETTLYGISRDDVERIRRTLVGDRPVPDASSTSFAAIVERLELLTA